MPFDIPDTWEWVRLCHLGCFSSGKTPSMSDKTLWGNDTMWVTSKDMKSEIISSSEIMLSEKGAAGLKKYPAGTLLMVARSGILRRLLPICTLGIESTINQDIKAFELFDTSLSELVFYFLKGQELEILRDYVKSVTTVESLKFDEFQNMLFPLPPKEEQIRILTKIHELRPLWEAYEKAENERISQNEEFPARLKKSILQQAVQGKLVPQNPTDEPAYILLERIHKEKEQLIKTGKIKRDKQESVIFRRDNSHYEKLDGIEHCIDDEIPFDIPKSWMWARCSSLGSIIRGNGIKRTETVSSGLPCVRYGEIYTSYTTSFTDAKSFIPDVLDKKCKHFEHGDILMTLTGESKPDIAKAVAYLGDRPVAAGGDLAYWTAHGMNPLYLVHIMSCPYIISRKVELATGDIIVHISAEKIGTILIPIPPLAEQNRIVAKIAELMQTINAM